MTAAPVSPPLDPERARIQHAAYRRALDDGGFSVSVLEPDERFPDSPFIEDTAVVSGRRALVTRPGHPDRRGEVDAVAAALETVGVEVHSTPADATLDGGDVLQVGGRTFVGIGARTNEAGAAVVADLVGNVTMVRVETVLHLKTAVTALDDTTVLCDVTVVDPSVFTGLDVVEAPERAAANVVRLPDGRLLVAAGHGETTSMLRSRGYELVEVDTSEFARADSGLTCLSLRLRDVLDEARQ